MFLLFCLLSLCVAFHFYLSCLFFFSDRSFIHPPDYFLVRFPITSSCDVCLHSPPTFAVSFPPFLLSLTGFCFIYFYAISSFFLSLSFIIITIFVSFFVCCVVQVRKNEKETTFFNLSLHVRHCSCCL